MKILIILIAFVVGLFLVSSPILAICSTWCATEADCTKTGCDSCNMCLKGSLGQIGGKPEEGFGPWGNLGSGTIEGAAGAFTKILSNVIGVMTVIAGLWFMFQFIIGGYGYMTAGEDPQKMGNATKKITSSLIGLVVIVAAYAVISLLGSMLGFDILNPQKIIFNLKP